MIDNLEPKPNMWEANPKLKMLSLVFIFVFLFCGIGLAVFSQWSASYRQKIYNQTQSELPKHIVKESDILNWKTYKNEQYGFEFNYPERFDSKIFNNELTIFESNGNGENNFEVRIRERYPSDLSLDKYFYLDFPISLRMEFGSQDATVFKAPNGYCDGPGCGKPFIAVVTEQGGYLYHMIFYGDAEFSEEELKIASTFKFTPTP